MNSLTDINIKNVLGGSGDVYPAMYSTRARKIEDVGSEHTHTLTIVPPSAAEIIEIVGGYTVGFTATAPGSISSGSGKAWTKDGEKDLGVGAGQYIFMQQPWERLKFTPCYVSNKNMVLVEGVGATGNDYIKLEALLECSAMSAAFSFKSVLAYNLTKITYFR